MVPRGFRPLLLTLIGVAVAATAFAERPAPASESKALRVKSALGYWAYENDYPGDAIWQAFQRQGTVDIQAVLLNGTVTGLVRVSATNCDPGVYTVEAVVTSSTNSIKLGKLKVRRTDAPSLSSIGHAEFGGAGSPLPDGVNPFDIASVTVSNASSVFTAVLNPDPPQIFGIISSTGTSYSGLNGFPVPASYYNALSPLASGTSDPAASGFVLIRATWGTPSLASLLQTPISCHLVIHAKGLPPSTILTYAADGKDLGAAATSAAGILNVLAVEGETLPTSFDPYAITTITIHDATGDVLATASL